MQTPNNHQSATEQQVAALHQHYCQLTGQKLILRYDRQRGWYELLRAGFTQQDVEQVVRYLQREILAERRRVGALKLSNFLQAERFEEDLNISRARLTRAPRKPTQKRPVSEPDDIFSPEEGARAFRKLRLQLQHSHTIQSDTHAPQSDTHAPQSENNPTA